MQSWQFDWFDALCPNFRPRFDPVEVMLVADCNYYSASVDALFASVLAHLLPDGTLFLASRVSRCSLGSFMERLRLHGGFFLKETVTFTEDESSTGTVATMGNGFTISRDEAYSDGDKAGGDSDEPIHRLWHFTFMPEGP